MSKGELDKVKTAVGLENIIDKASKDYAKLNLKYIVHNPEELLLAHPLLLKTPIVRNGSRVTVGYQPELWREWD